MPSPRRPVELPSVEHILGEITESFRQRVQDGLQQAFEAGVESAGAAPARAAPALQKALAEYAVAAEGYIRDFNSNRNRGQRVEKLEAARAKLRELGFVFEER